jgi:hypothetical protein
MRNVLFLGKSDRRIEEWAKAHAAVVKGDGGRVIFLSLYGADYNEDNFSYINCFNVKLKWSAAEIQRRIPVSINRAIACDRSLADYTWSSSYGSYSRYSLEQIERLAVVVGNALLEYMPKVDYCIDGLFDNFVSPLAFYVSQTFGIKFYSIRLWQYWDTRFHVVDAPHNVSSEVDRLYAKYYPRLNANMYPRVAEEFRQAYFRPIEFSNQDNRVLRRQIIRDKMRSYERPSLPNLVRRRIDRFVGSFTSRALRFVPHAARPKQYVLWALHVMPEASILGTDPEVADQFSLIRRMSLNVPLGVQILLKAHPGERFGRDIAMSFVRHACALPNVSLVPETESIHTFLNDERCIAMATINGSVALEAVMADKPCFLFGRGIFSIADCFLKPSDDQQFFEQLMAILGGRYAIDKVALAAIILSMKRATLPGAPPSKTPGSWLEFYKALLPSIHLLHKRLMSRNAPQ